MKIFKNTSWSLFFILGFCLHIGQPAFSSEKKIDCSSVLASVEGLKETLQNQASSLKHLFGDTGKSVLDLNGVFQADLNDKASLSNVKSEFHGLTNKDALATSPEYKNYFSCAKTEADKQAIENLSALQLEVNKMKLRFLDMDSEKQQELLIAYRSGLSQKENVSNLDKALQKSNDLIESTKAKLHQSEEGTASAGNAESEEILTAKSLIEKTLIDFESNQVQFMSSLQSKNVVLSEQQSELSELIKTTNLKNSPQLSSAYEIVVEIWRQAADDLFSLYSNIDLRFSPQIPELLVMTPDEAKTKDLYSEYLQAYEKIKSRKKALPQARIKLTNELIAQTFVLLSDAGSFRATVLRSCDEIGCNRKRGLNQGNIEDFVREIKLVPFKFISGGINKWLEIRSKLTSGVDGWINILKQIFILMGLLFIPFLLIRSLRWTSARLDSLRKNLLARSMMDYRKRTGVAVWINRLNPFLPAVGMILAIHLSRSLIENTDISEISRFLYYFEIYFLYSLCRQVVTILLEILFTTDSIEVHQEQKNKIEKTSTRVTRLVFIEYVLLHITQDAVRKAFVYQILYDLIFLVNIALIIFESSKWKSEILESFFYRTPNLAPKLKVHFHKKWSGLLLPFIFLIIIVYDIGQAIGQYLIRIDLVKKILSETLRKKLEKVEKSPASKNKPPSEYLKEFDYYLPAEENIFVTQQESPIDKIDTLFNQWATGKASDDLILAVGNRGMGKTTALQHVRFKLQESTQILASQIPNRTLSSKALFDWLSKLTSTPISSIEDFIKYDAALPQKILLLIDDIQNLFLGTIGGFEVYLVFLEIISLRTKNIFCCLTVNSRSWAYLNGVFGKEHFYGKQINLQSWSDTDIQKLILSRHKQTGYKRSFDESIKVYGAGDALGRQAEGQFFRLLWGQSRGNPRSALMYWISALSSPATNLIHVGVPSFVSSSLVASMSDDALFLLSAIAKHESLNHDELIEITKISSFVIRKCLKEAQDKDLLWIDEHGKVRISSRAQYVIDYFLIGKNFLYE